MHHKAAFVLLPYLFNMQCACAVYCHLWPVWLYPILTPYVIHDTLGGGELLKIKRLFWFSVQNFFSCNISHSEKNSSRCHHKRSLACLYRGADKSLARPGRKQARKHVRRYARDFNKIERRTVIKYRFLQGKAPKEIHAILTETLACFLPGRAKNLSAPL